MPKEVFENDSKDFISDLKDTVAVTSATDDDKQQIMYKSVSFPL